MFTFSSKKPGACSIVLFLVLGFLLSAVAGEIMMPRFQSAVTLRQRMRSVSPPPNGILALFWEHFDHRFLFHNIRGSLNAALTADVLIVGNSHAQFGFDQAMTRTGFAARGQTVFNLALVYLGCSMPLAIIRKYDMHPKIVIISADGFFSDMGRGTADQYIKTGWWDISKLYFESTAAFEIERRFHRVLPYWGDWKLGMVALRNLLTGWWELAYWAPQPEIPIGLATNDRPVEDVEVINGREFKEEIERRGGRIIMVFIPKSGAPSTTHYRALAERLGVPFIEVSAEGLMARDRAMHLSDVSAQMFTQRFFERYDAVVPSSSPRS